MRKETALEQYKRLFTPNTNFVGASDGTDLKFHQTYPTCPQVQSIRCLDIEVDCDTAESWMNMDGEGEEPNMYSILMDSELEKALLNKDVMDYIDVNVKEKKFLDEMPVILNPVNPVNLVRFYNNELGWETIVQIKEMRTSVGLFIDCELFEDIIEFDDLFNEGDNTDSKVFVYLYWDKVLTRSWDPSEDQKVEAPKLIVANLCTKDSDLTKDAFKGLAEAFNKGEEVVLEWPLKEDLQIREGDKVWLMMIDELQDGFVATGTILSDTAKTSTSLASKDGCHNVRIKMDTMYNPDGYICNTDERLLPEFVNADNGLEVAAPERKRRLQEYMDFFVQGYNMRPEKFRNISYFVKPKNKQ